MRWEGIKVIRSYLPFIFIDDDGYGIKELSLKDNSFQNLCVMCVKIKISEEEQTINTHSPGKSEQDPQLSE